MNYIDDENELYYENLVRKDIRNLSKVPLKFQTFKVQQIAFDKGKGKGAFQCIPKEALSEEIILYAIEKGFVNNSIFYDIPNEFKTYEVCKNSVIHCPSIIKLVPLKFITKEFLKELNESNVHISEYYMGYIKECIQANDKINGVISLNEKTNIETSKSPKNKLPDNIKYIDLNTLDFINPYILKVFKTFGINNLGELFDATETSEFYEYCYEYFTSSEWENKFSREKHKKEKSSDLTNTIRLLKCKYLDEAPLIEIDDEQMDIIELFNLLAFSKKTFNALVRSNIFSGINAKEYFKIFQDYNIEETLLKTRNISRTSFCEIMGKTNIILDYYKRHNKDEKNREIKEDETIEYLKNELQRLREESKKIDMQIDTIIEKIQEKTLNQSKGGAIK